MRRASRAGHRLRRRLLARGPCQCAGRRHIARHVAHEPRAGGQPAGSRLHGRARRHARGSQPLSARHRAVLPDRSGRQCQHRRHDGDAGLGHQRRALRHHARQRAVADCRDGRRPHRHDRQACQEELGRLRFDAAADRLGRHARHHHGDHAEAAGHPAGDRRRRVPVPERRGSLLGGHRDDPDGHSGGPHRTGQCAADAGDDQLFQARLSRDARACSSSSTAARQGLPSRRLRSARSSRNMAADRSSRRPMPRSAPSCGRPGTTPTGRR